MRQLSDASKHFTHYAAQWRHAGGTWRHFDLDGGSVAVFTAQEGAELCAAEAVAAGLPPGVETRTVRYHTSGYVDVAFAPREARDTGYFDMPAPEPAYAPRAKPRHVPKEIEVIE